MNFSNRTTQQKGPEFQIAPMIDIIFLILIFFMVAATFQQLEEEAEVKLPIADESKTKMDVHGEIVINVTKDGTVIVNKEEYELTQLQDVLVEETHLVEKMRKVTIRGDRDTEFQYVRQVMKICTYAGIWDVSFATYQEEPG